MSSQEPQPQRNATVSRRTKETAVRARIGIDGTGTASIRTGIGFLDHMLTLLAHHGRIDLDLQAEGDLEVDHHHTCEDVGIVLGEGIRESVGDHLGIERYSHVTLPMDEALVAVSLDISGRPYLAWNVEFPSEKIGSFDTELVLEWFRAVAMHARFTLHVDRIRGSNAHHTAEACFKAFGRALHAATRRCQSRSGQIPSTKGSITGARRT